LSKEKTKDELKMQICSILAQGQTSWHQIIKKLQIETYQQRNAFLDILNELQEEEKIYRCSRSQYVLFPKDYFIGYIKDINNYLQLVANNQLVPVDQTKFRDLLKGDMVVVRKNIETSTFEIKKILKRDIDHLEKQMMQMLEAKPRSYHQIKRFACANHSNDIEKLNQLLDKLKADGKIYYANDVFSAIDHITYDSVRIETTSKGQLYYISDGNTIYLDRQQMKGLIPNDQVLIDKKSGKVKKIIYRKNNRLAFEVVLEDGVKTLKILSFQEEQNIKVRIDSNHMKKLQVGDKIIANVSKEKTDDGYFEGNYIDTIHPTDEISVDLAAIILSKGFHLGFHQEYLKEVDKLASTVNSEEMNGRYDFRDKQVFTIDCDETKDMDDAVSIDILPNGHYLLGVHIADVSHYVKRGSAIYKEAKQRSTSVYPLNSVIPMLHQKLSNGICSLNPGVDRLTKSCLIEFNADGEVVHYDIVKSVICSKQKMCYSKVNQALIQDDVPDEYLAFIQDLKMMQQLSDLITMQSYIRGKLNFATTDVRAILDEKEKPVNFILNNQGEAGKMIENFMISANSCVDQYLSYIIPCSIHRIHALPLPSEIEQVFEKLKLLGYKTKNTNNKDPRFALQGILDSYAGTKDFPIISKLCLTSMKRANYSSLEQGHYGLGLRYYTHFTSPIRRFPDLRTHELIDQLLENKLIDYEKLEAEMFDICNHSSFMERQADAVEYQALILKEMEYIDAHPNSSYQGIVTDICHNKIYVQTNNHIPGYVNYEDIEAPIQFSPMKKIIINEKNIPILRIGHEVSLTSIESDKTCLLAHFSLDDNLTLKQTQTNAYQKTLSDHRFHQNT